MDLKQGTQRCCSSCSSIRAVCILAVVAAISTLITLTIISQYPTKANNYRTVTNLSHSGAHLVTSWRPLKQNCTSASHSSYHILNPKPTYAINDRIQVIIEARDKAGARQQFGGAYFRAKIVSLDVKAASRSDIEIIDLKNGSYLAEFVLRWPGKVSISVMLVQSDCANRVMDRIISENPNRAIYIATFKNGDAQEQTACNVGHVTSPENECDFSDRESGVEWYCERPHHLNLTCKDWWWTNSNNPEIYKMQKKYLAKGDEAYFDSFKTMLNCNRCTISVQSGAKELYSWQSSRKKLPPCTPGKFYISNETSGYYYQEKWYSTQCRNRAFNDGTMINCLRNKVVFVHGDSTVRQWFEFFQKQFHMVSKPKVNCISKAHQPKYNLTIYYKFHGPPTRGRNGGPSLCTKGNEIRILDHLPFKPDIYILCIGSHFTLHSTDLYAHRLDLIRGAVERLKKRNPNTTIILKTMNTREFKTIEHIVSNNERYMYQLDRLYREKFSAFPGVALVDAWDMTVAQFTPDSVHPAKPTVENEIHLALSYACPA